MSSQSKFVDQKTKNECTGEPFKHGFDIKTLRAEIDQGPLKLHALHNFTRYFAYESANSLIKRFLALNLVVQEMEVKTTWDEPTRQCLVVFKAMSEYFNNAIQTTQYDQLKSWLNDHNVKNLDDLSVALQILRSNVEKQPSGIIHFIAIENYVSETVQVLAQVFADLISDKSLTYNNDHSYELTHTFKQVSGIQPSSADEMASACYWFFKRPPHEHNFMLTLTDLSEFEHETSSTPIAKGRRFTARMFMDEFRLQRSITTQIFQILDSTSVAIFSKYMIAQSVTEIIKLFKTYSNHHVTQIMKIIMTKPLIILYENFERKWKHIAVLSQNTSSAPTFKP